MNSYLSTAKKAKFNPLHYPVIFINPDRLDAISAWIEHIPFGMLIVDLLRPKVFVELGTHTGVSYSAICQAVKYLNLDTKCYAIDTWQGDKHSGYYDEKIFSNLLIYNENNYSEFSKLIRNTFDNASKYFANGSIDLLHIDGLHTYEAVKNDFETWIPKISKTGVIMFHDINETTSDFGVWKLWDELKLTYPSFEFTHGHGLGILLVGKDYPTTLNLLLNSVLDTPLIQEFFSRLGGKISLDISHQSLVSNLADKDQTIQTMKGKLTEFDQIIYSFSEQLSERHQTIQTMQGILSERDQTIHLLNDKSFKLEQIVNSLNVKLYELEQTVKLLNSENLMYAQSKSWRYTRPLRKIKKIISD